MTTEAEPDAADVGCNICSVEDEAKMMAAQTSCKDVDEVASVFTDMTTGESMDNMANDMGVMEMESMCMNCHEDGTTRLLLMTIPFFRDVIVMSFTCGFCHYRSNEIENAGAIEERGIKIACRVQSKVDLNRQLVKTKYTTIKIPDLDFEIPPGRGELTTIEGILQQTCDGLEMQQPIRRIQHPEVAAGIDAFLEKLRAMQAGETPFSFEMSDPSGNSFVENPEAPKQDPQLTITRFFRNEEENSSLGIGVQEGNAVETAPEASTSATAAPPLQAPMAPPPTDAGEGEGAGVGDATKEEDEEDEEELWNTDRVGHNEAMVFKDIQCPECNNLTETRMKVVDIPHFSEVIVMATTCDKCGYKTNDVRVGGAIEPNGVRITLKVTCKDDLSRDILKTETASLEIPELDLKTGEGTLGGGFTTIDGILTQVVDQLSRANPFMVGDSAQQKDGKLMGVVDKIKGYIEFSEPFHIVLDDPIGKSYIQNLYAPDSDPEMTVTSYVRTEEQNIEFGLTDMKTENYAGEDDASGSLGAVASAHGNDGTAADAPVTV